ncbi:MAG: hypothetical protein LJE65_00595 [Desulfobacteraceae bacterium]|nr:hypothetical protein [Desulfobacteraceae bacterium]
MRLCPDASPFTLTRQQLLEVARELERRTREGLSRRGAQLQCLTTYLPIRNVPSAGRVMVLDLGGSRLRAAVVRLRGATPVVERGPLETAMPWERNRQMDRKRYLEVQADLLEGLEEAGPISLGYCFSYPAEPLPDRDAKLLSWTKEIRIPETEGKRVGRMLVDFLHRRGKIRCSRVTVINDTVASLLAGVTRPPADACIGLIVGTGTNLAALVPGRRIRKLADPSLANTLLPLNLESGNFDPPHRTREDRVVDETSGTPGKQRFEKAVSGAYLGRLMAAACPGAGIEPDLGAEELGRLAHPDRESNSHVRMVAGRILRRSARYVAAASAGLLAFLNADDPVRSVRIVAEGGLYWSRLNGVPAYARQVEGTLRELLPELGLPDIFLNIECIENANLAGTAVAALLD